jgi:hypothetical protein
MDVHRNQTKTQGNRVEPYNHSPSLMINNVKASRFFLYAMLMVQHHARFAKEWRLLSFGFADVVDAQDWPSHNVTVVVPLPPGTASECRVSLDGSAFEDAFRFSTRSRVGVTYLQIIPGQSDRTF